MNSFDRDNPELKERYSRLRTLINSKHKIEDIIAPYYPDVYNHPKRIVSILNVHDSDPSMFLDYRKNVWKCFSTGKGGGYLELVYYLRVLREQEENVDIWQIANKMLKEDQDFQKQLGFTSLFRKVIPTVLEPVLREKRVERVEVVPLATIFKNLASKKDKGLFYKAISDFEAGMPINDLIDKYRFYKPGTVSLSETKSLESLITSLFGGGEDV